MSEGFGDTEKKIIHPVAFPFQTKEIGFFVLLLQNNPSYKL